MWQWGRKECRCWEGGWGMKNARNKERERWRTRAVGRMVISRPGRAEEDNHTEGPWPVRPGAMAPHYWPGSRLYLFPQTSETLHSGRVLCALSNWQWVVPTRQTKKKALSPLSSFLLIFGWVFWLHNTMAQYNNSFIKLPNPTKTITREKNPIGTSIVTRIHAYHFPGRIQSAGLDDMYNNYNIHWFREMPDRLNWVWYHVCMILCVPSASYLVVLFQKH